MDYVQDVHTVGQVTEEPANSRRKLGAFYTPGWAVDHMLNLVVDLENCATILEPSGGDGAFVQGLVKAGTRSENITVKDINAQVRPLLESLGVTVAIEDTLLSKDDKRYDLIVGNPPYLNKQSDYIKENKQALRREYGMVGANDTYAMFTYWAVQHLKPGGQLVFLISDTFLTLGIHRRLRQYLLAHTTIDSVTLLPKSTFPDAAVNTAILKLTKKPAGARHLVRFTDARNSSGENLAESEEYQILQAELEDNPSCLWTFTNEDRQGIQLAKLPDKLMNYLDGGLGMHTKDNQTYLRKAGSKATEGCRPYHKKGGKTRWFAPVDHEVTWNEHTREKYGIPKSALAGKDDTGADRRGLIVSGIAQRLSARTMSKGALWESNKAFGLFPKNPDKYPVEFFLAIFNSSTYNLVAQALNHTSSMQVRDLNVLPMLDYTAEEIAELARLGFEAAAWVRDGGKDASEFETRIDEIVQVAARRTLEK